MEFSATFSRQDIWKKRPEFLYKYRKSGEFLMFTEDTFRRHAQEVLTLADQLAKARRLFKTEGGHLTQAGRSIVVEGERQGLATSEIADLLEVSPAVVRYHLRQQQREREPHLPFERLHAA
jgi:hypothetical protein